MRIIKLRAWFWGGLASQLSISAGCWFGEWTRVANREQGEDGECRGEGAGAGAGAEASGASEHVECKARAMSGGKGTRQEHGALGNGSLLKRYGT